MKKGLIVLLFLLSIAHPKPLHHQIPGSQSDKYTKYYNSQFEKVKQHFKVAQERSLQQTTNTTHFILPTNMTLISRRRRHMHGLHNFLEGYLEGTIDPHFFHANRPRLTPLFNRFRFRRRAISQMSCSLSVRVGGMQNFFRIGVVLVRMTFFSSCMTEPYTKFIWVNIFDSATHFRLRINRRSFMFLFGNIVQRTSQFQAMAHYNSYKMLSLFRAGVFNLRAPPTRRRRRRQTRVGSKRRVRKERLLRSLDTSSKTTKSVKQHPSKKPQKLTHNKLPYKNHPLKKSERKLIDKIPGNKNQAIESKTTKLTKSQKPKKLAKLPKATKLQNATAQISETASPFLEDSRKLQFGGWRNPFRRSFWRRPSWTRRRRRRRRQQRRRQRPAPVRVRRRPPVVHIFKAGPPAFVNLAGEQFIRGVVNNDPGRHRNLQRSFSNLLNRNDESNSVFLRRVHEPINILPRIDWRPVGRRREILSSGNNRRPFWRFRTIRRIWRGSSPQIAPSRPIAVLRDSLITVAI